MIESVFFLKKMSKPSPGYILTPLFTFDHFICVKGSGIVFSQLSNKFIIFSGPNISILKLGQGKNLGDFFQIYLVDINQAKESFTS